MLSLTYLVHVHIVNDRYGNDIIFSVSDHSWEVVDKPLLAILDGVNAYASVSGWSGEKRDIVMMHLGGLRTDSKMRIFAELFSSGAPSKRA